MFLQILSGELLLSLFRIGIGMNWTWNDRIKPGCVKSGSTPKSHSQHDSIAAPSQEPWAKSSCHQARPPASTKAPSPQKNKLVLD